MDKSRSTKRTEAEDTLKTLNKSRSISSASFSDKSTKIEKPKEIDIRKENSSISGMSGHGSIVSSKLSDKQRILCKNKIHNNLETSIKVYFFLKK